MNESEAVFKMLVQQADFWKMIRNIIECGPSSGYNTLDDIKKLVKSQEQERIKLSRELDKKINK